jgi:hypothetical protein
MKNQYQKLMFIAMAVFSISTAFFISCIPTSGTTPTTSGFTTVVNRTETSINNVQYKIYLQDTATTKNRKGIILLGSGNNESNPTTGSLSGGLENKVALDLAKLGYIAAVVAYRDEPAVNWSDGGVSWNSNCEMLATDMSNVANTIITKYSAGLTRAKVITGGVSYTSYALLSNIAASNTLADTKGLLATCGSTGSWQAQNFKIPIYNINCAGNPEGDLHGQALINAITNTTIKNNSGFFEDNSCSTHCGGDINTWSAKMIDRVKVWIP